MPDATRAAPARGSICTNCNGVGAVPRALGDGFDVCLDCSGTGAERTQPLPRAAQLEPDAIDEGTVEPSDVDAIQFCINCVGAQVSGRHDARVVQAQAQLAALIDQNRKLQNRLDSLLHLVGEGPDPREDGTCLLIHATPTDQLTTIDGMPARVWNAMTDDGVPFLAFITRVAVHEDQDPAAFEAALKAMPQPREVTQAEAFRSAFPHRLVH